MEEKRRRKGARILENVEKSMGPPPGAPPSFLRPLPPREDRFFCAAAALAAALGERCSLADSFEDSFVWRPTVGCFGAGTADGIAFGAGTPPLSADLWVPFPTETETTAGAAESFPPPRLIFANASTPIFSAADGTGTGAGAAFLESPPPPLAELDLFECG